MRGHTLVELTFVMTLAAVGAASLAPAARRYRDSAAVAAARETTIGLLAEARAAGVTSGRGVLAIATGPSRVWLVSTDSTLHAVALESEYGVDVELTGGRSSTEIAFNALGLGSFANETLVFRRGDATATLVVSGYGRARRR